MKNIKVAEILYNIADILDLQGVQWKPRAYREAAQAIEQLEEPIEDISARGALEDIPHVGENIAAKIEEIITTGKLRYYEKLKKQVNVDIGELKKIPALGFKRIKVLHRKAGIKDVADLEKAIARHVVCALPGFGEKTERAFLEGIRLLKRKIGRIPYEEAVPIAKKIVTVLSALPFVTSVDVAGSFRRKKETIGDLDVLVVSEKPAGVMSTFRSLGTVLASGPTKSSIRLDSGLQVDLRVVKLKEYGAALLYFTGDKQYNIKLRKLALKKGYTLNEYGLFRLKNKRWKAGRTEEEIFAALGLKYKPPTQRH